MRSVLINLFHVKQLIRFSLVRNLFHVKQSIQLTLVSICHWCELVRGAFECGPGCDAGTGSNPPAAQGTQRAIRTTPSPTPFSTPKRSIASSVYCEQVGW